jgi:hypothetical protein
MQAIAALENVEADVRRTASGGSERALSRGAAAKVKIVGDERRPGRRRTQSKPSSRRARATSGERAGSIAAIRAGASAMAAASCDWNTAGR